MSPKPAQCMRTMLALLEARKAWLVAGEGLNRAEQALAAAQTCYGTATLARDQAQSAHQHALEKYAAAELLNERSKMNWTAFPSPIFPSGDSP